MPKQEITVSSAERDNLRPKASFDPESLFGERLGDESHLRRCCTVGAGVAQILGNDGGGVAVLDGSSSFVAGVALALEAAKGDRNRSYLIRTNNLAIFAELHARQLPKLQLTAEVLEGHFTHSLYASFPDFISHDYRERLSQAPIRLVSVRSLSYYEGVSSPNWRSLAVKRAALSTKGAVAFLADSEKLSEPLSTPTHSVFNTDEEWKDFLSSRRVWIFTDDPADDDSFPKAPAASNPPNQTHKPQWWNQEGHKLDRFRANIAFFEALNTVTVVVVKRVGQAIR